MDKPIYHLQYLKKPLTNIPNPNDYNFPITLAHFHEQAKTLPFDAVIEDITLSLIDPLLRITSSPSSSSQPYNFDLPFGHISIFDDPTVSLEARTTLDYIKEMQAKSAELQAVKLAEDKARARLIEQKISTRAKYYRTSSSYVDK